MTDDNRTLQELAKEALEAQNGSNLTGLLGSFARSNKRLRQIGAGLGGDIRDHPVTFMWVSKISDLCGNPNSDPGTWYARMQSRCEELANPRPPMTAVEQAERDRFEFEHMKTPVVP